VAADADVRVTVVGDRLFPTAIRATPGGYDVDYRMDLAGATFTPTDLPQETERRLRALMARLGLVYGAIDLRRTPDGDVFLEVNPAGEWRFIEERTGQPITDAMADLLTSLDRP
jgi:glutathione synthase/RimK-type ligase-like ATP-grasp enzyme